MSKRPFFHMYPIERLYPCSSPVQRHKIRKLVYISMKQDRNYSYCDAKNNLERNAHWVSHSFIYLVCFYWAFMVWSLWYALHLRYRNEHEGGSRQEASVWSTERQMQRYILGTTIEGCTRAYREIRSETHSVLSLTRWVDVPLLGRGKMAWEPGTKAA